MAICAELIWLPIIFLISSPFSSPFVQECRYLVKDFGTSQSPKSTRLRDNRYAPTVLRPSRFRITHLSYAARVLLHHDSLNDSTACRMRFLYALHHSLPFAISAIQPRLRLSGTTSLRFALLGWQRIFVGIFLQIFNPFLTDDRSHFS